MKEEYIVTEIHDRCASNSNGDEIYWAKVRKVKKVEYKCNKCKDKIGAVICPCEVAPKYDPDYEEWKNK